MYFDGKIVIPDFRIFAWSEFFYSIILYAILANQTGAQKTGTLRVNKQILLLDGQGKNNHRDGRGLSHQGLGLRTEPRPGVHHQTGKGQGQKRTLKHFVKSRFYS